MTDLEIAKQNLPGHSLVLAREELLVKDDGRGISPLMSFLSEGRTFIGWSGADTVVGKASAMLFRKAGVIAVYGETMSESAKRFLDANGIRAEYGTLAPYIVNREGTDMCPMEKTVKEIEDVEEAYRALTKKLAELRFANTKKG